MPAVSFDLHATAPPDVIAREIDGETVLLDLEGGNYYGLDEIGTRMWVLLTTSPTIEAAFEVLLGEFDVDSGTLREDLTALVTRLTDEKLLELTSEQSTDH